MSDGSRTPAETARAYYRALDGDDYELLADLLAPDFSHVRPDMTIDGRDRFVRFMREERPMTDTSHPVDGVYVPTRGDGDRDEDGNGDGDGDEDGFDPAGSDEIAVRGRLLDPDGDLITRFVDVFFFEGSEVVRIRTFTG